MDVDTNNSKSLAGIFKTISSDNKKLEPFIDDFVEKTHKLETQLKSTIVIFSSFIDSFKRISEKSFKKRKGTSNDIIEWILKTSEHHYVLKHLLLSVTKVMSNGLFNLKLKLDERKKNINMLEKVHGKEYKLLKNEIKKKKECLSKLKKKVSKEHLCDKDSLEMLSKQIVIKHQLFENQEKQAVRRICQEERGLYCDVAGFMKQLLIKEAEMSKEMISVEESVQGIQKCIENPNDIPDSVMNEILDCSHSDIMEFDTPATSVNGSLRGSRCNSFSSLNSLRPSSPLCIIEQKDNTCIGLRKFGSIRRKSQFTTYGRNKIAEGVSLSYANPFYTQHLMGQDNYDSNPLFSPYCSQTENYSHQARSRRQSCSPTREVKLPDATLAFSTIRRTRSPYRKQNLNNVQEIEYKVSSQSRPPIPRKLKNATNVTDEYQQPCFLATHTGPDTGLSIVNSGAIKAMASISRQDLNDRHLWSETILPEGRRIPVNRSLSLSEQRKANHTLVMSDSLVKTLDTLHLDEFIHGR